MKSMSSLGLGLSVVFGCLLLALAAELYYLFWGKKRFANREVEDEDSSPAMDLLYMFCWRRPSSLTQSALNPQQLPEANKGLLLKPFGEDGNGVESELMRLSGPPRFLFTIVEETKEDLESEDGKGSRSRSFTVETPFLTPLASPSLFPPLDSTCSPRSFNPLFESSSDAEFCRVIRSSPPPKFKFLQDAEEKFNIKKPMEEEAHTKAHQTIDATGSQFSGDDEDGSFITLIVDRNEERDYNTITNSYYSSTC